MTQTEPSLPLIEVEIISWNQAMKYMAHSPKTRTESHTHLHTRKDKRERHRR